MFASPIPLATRYGKAQLYINSKHKQVNFQVDLFSELKHLHDFFFYFSDEILLSPIILTSNISYSFKMAAAGITHFSPVSRLHGRNRIK